MTRHPVIVGVDGSRQAIDAVGWAAEHAHRHGTRLRLVHAYDITPDYPSLTGERDSLQSAMREHGTTVLRAARLAASSAAPGLEIELHAVQASTVPALLDESAGGSLLVLGSRGAGYLLGMLVGAKAVTLAGHAACPVAVVRGRAGDSGIPATGPVVVGVDGTPRSEGAIAFAFEEASRRGVELLAVHTWSDVLIPSALGDVAAEDFEPLQQEAYEILAERLAGWQAQYPDVKVTREVLRDRPAPALLRYSSTAALLVVGSRGRGGFRSLALGSTSQKLLHHAECPTVVVRVNHEGGEST